MINLKKTLVTVFLLGCVVSSLFCVPDVGARDNNIARSAAEEKIVFSDSDSETETAGNIEDSKKEKGFSSGKVFIRMIVVLLIVVGLIYLVFHFIKKKTHFVKSDDDYLRRAAYINIAPGKTVEVITLIDKAYLIGVTEDNITLLGEIDDDELIKAINITADKKNNTKKPSTFSEVLDMFVVKGNKRKNVFDDSELKVDSVISSEETKE